MESTSERAREPTLYKHDRPPCFGDPEMVCREDENGLLKPQEECLSCCLLKSCSKRALLLRAMLRAPAPEPTAVSRVTGFLKRWSSQKLESSSTSNRDDRK